MSLCRLLPNGCCVKYTVTAQCTAFSASYPVSWALTVSAMGQVIQNPDTSLSAVDVSRWNRFRQWRVFLILSAYISNAGQNLNMPVCNVRSNLTGKA